MTGMEGKVIAITGGASGIGLATAKLLYARGATICLADIQTDLLSKATESIKTDLPAGTSATVGQKITTNRVNVKSTQEINEWIEGIVKEFGKLDGAVNCAGVSGTIPMQIHETTDEELENVVAINCNGTFKCLRAELNAMTSGGAIVNISSVAGVIGWPYVSAYTASKHAVIGMTKQAAREQGSKGIRVNAVCPGLTDTPMIQAVTSAAEKGFKEELKNQAIQRVGDPKEVGRTICYLLSEDASFVTGAAMPVDGGWVA